MALNARRVLGLGLLLLAGQTYAGCAARGTGSDPARPDTAEAGSPEPANDAGSNESAGAPEGGRNGTGGMGTLNTDPMSGAGAPDESCATDVSTAEIVPLDIFIMMDTSLSMNDVTENGIVKWAAVKGALETFLQDDSSNGLGVGIQYFPKNRPNIPASCLSDAECGAASPCLLKFCFGYDTVYPCITDSDCVGGFFDPPADCEPFAKCGTTDIPCKGVGGECQDDTKDDGQCALVSDPAELANDNLGVCVNTAKCDAASYSVPDQPIVTLPAAAPALIASIDAQTPAGNTPTGPALTGVISQASTWALAHPDHQVISLLVTDGLPSQCGPTSITDIGKIASNGLAATPSIKTFVVGVFGSEDIGAGAASNLSKIAKAGGTDGALIVYTSDDVSTQFLTALDSIRSTQLSCDYLIPAAKPGNNLDYTKLNVSFSSGNKKSTLFYVGSADGCDPLSGGWYYDTDPSQSDPTRIEICPSTCTAFKAAKSASVEIAIGCETVIK